MSLDSILRWLARSLSPSSQTPMAARVPAWEGWLVLGALLTVFGLLVWWLYASLLPERRGQPSAATMSARARLILGGLVLLGGVLFTLGARWDELWHRMFGGFGDDFLWPPHLMIYGSLGLNSAFAGFGLAVAARGGGGLRERFRANPLVGLLGLLSAYQLASIPSDLIWHKIIGPDISAWALPHFLLEISSSAVLLIGLALVLSARPRRSWRLLGVPSLVELFAIALLGVSTLALLQFGVTEWEWHFGGGLPFDRPVWVYPVVVLLMGIVEAHLVLFGLKRIGAATALALAVLAAQWVLVAASRAALPPGPDLVSQLLLVVPAVALDAWYASRRSRLGATSTLVGGVVLYSLVFFAVTAAAIRQLMWYPAFRPNDVVVMLGLGLPAALLVSVGARAVGGRLGNVGVVAVKSRLPVEAELASRPVVARS